MSKLELYEDDPFDESDILTTECPICGKSISFSLDQIGSTISCPHCDAEIALESN